MDCWKNAVGPRIKRVNNAIDFWRTQDMDRLGLTTTQGYLLGWLTRNADKSVTPSELGRSFKLSQPTISGILQRLEAKGFVTMEADSNDRRRKYVRTTDRAAECHQQIVSGYGAAADRSPVRGGAGNAARPAGPYDRRSGTGRASAGNGGHTCLKNCSAVSGTTKSIRS